MSGGFKRIGVRWWHAGWICLLLLGFPSAFEAQAEQRFPPPDFESGYEVPETKDPAARASALEYFDVTVLAVALGLASFFALKKRSRKGLVWLSVFSLLYFGFYREGCVCAIGSVQNVALALFDTGYAVPLTVMAFFALPLLASLFFGRAFCAGVCPHGALQDLVLVKAVTVPRWLESGLSLIPFFYLGAAVLFAATGSGFLICRYDPFIPLFRMTGGMGMVLAGGMVVGVAMFVGRPYCRFLCPYGALLRAGATVSKWQVTITPSACTQCRLCEQSCPYGAIEMPESGEKNGLARNRERSVFAALVLLLPVWAGVGIWAGGATGSALAGVHPAVRWTGHYLNPKAPEIELKAERLARQRIASAPDESLRTRDEIRARFRTGGHWLGGWIGLVIGIKLLALSGSNKRSVYEPNRAGCLSCGRCFQSCPQHLIATGEMAPGDPRAIAPQIAALGRGAP